ncbi:MAG: FAD-binding oxidoreductase [Bacteriovoracaceae bacterium]
MSVSFWNDDSANKNLEADIAIIGGGVAGLSCAYWLQKSDPNMKIALVEKYEIGSGASGRNAGFVTCGSVEHFNRLTEKHGPEEALDIWRFSETNMELLKQEIIQENPRDFLFEQKGSCSLASTPSEFKELQESARIMAEKNIKVEVLDQKDISKRLGAANFVGGIKYCDDGSINPVLLLNGIRKKLGENVAVLENHEVFDIQTEGEYKLLKTDKTNIRASMAVYATNGYSALLNHFFEDKIFPTRGQILATEPLPQFMEAPCYANFVLDYFRQLPTGEMIIGGFRQLQKDAEKGYSDEVSQVIQEALEKFLKERIPPAKNARITHRWSGIMGFSADGQPMVGSTPQDPQSLFCAGFTAHGIGLAFHSAKVLADCVFGRKIPKFISAKRFN